MSTLPLPSHEAALCAPYENLSSLRVSTGTVCGSVQRAARLSPDVLLGDYGDVSLELATQVSREGRPARLLRPLSQGKQKSKGNVRAARFASYVPLALRRFFY